ncbi:glycoside hydrolase family 27 protein [Mycena maculata]|uniref:Alpha-galactosidase n=1 Tax=Mycena maculata TaxID=230809 RepID=A0AAD7HBG8_9AGAR|nr:glycoside hydrolase family 27 protein [Mycena maculata]
MDPTMIPPTTTKLPQIMKTVSKEVEHVVPQRPVSPPRYAMILTSAVSLALGIALTSVSMLYGTHRTTVARVGRLPVMGYNTWNAYHCDINETLILETAQLIKSLGLADVGYNYVNIDDCYSEKTRTAGGDIVEDKTRFPSGMKWLTDQIHALDLKAGIYSDAGWFTCALYPGSFQNEERDAKLFSEEWGFDLLKYDNCAVPFDEITRENIIGRYTRMSNAIAAQAKASGKPPLVLSLCEWGREQPWLWARRLGQSWRTTTDITPDWNSIASIIDQNSFYSWASDFYGHGDLDMLEVGNGELTFEEAKAHFTVWSFLKSPLLIGAQLAAASDETLEILKNMEIIGINQDPVVGTAVTPFRWGLNPDWTANASFPAQYWSGESQNGTIVMLLNVLDEPADMFFNLTESPWIRAGRQYFVRDLWSHTDNGTAVRNVSVPGVPAHGVVALLLRDAGDEPEGIQPRCAVAEWCIDKNGTFV